MAENINLGLQKGSVRRYFARLGFKMLGSNQLGGEVWLLKLQTQLLNLDKFNNYKYIVWIDKNVTINDINNLLNNIKTILIDNYNIFIYSLLQPVSCFLYTN